jgi:hypothetical protein
MHIRRSLYRVHIWLAWLIGVPLLFWTVSGLWMVARPIEEVRGTALKAEPTPVFLTRPLVAPDAGKRAIKSLILEQQQGKARWIINFADGGQSRADPATGKLLPPVTLGEARQLAVAALKGQSSAPEMVRVTATNNPIELRRERPAWQADFPDGTHVFIDAETGQLLAVRTAQWRVYDWFWGLHIMDLQGRENTHHALLIGFAALAAIGVLLALVQLPISVWRRSR